MNNIFEKYPTDKKTGYAGVYEDAFSNINREDIKLVFELGVYQGGGLKGFRDYFPNANIVGLDINPKMNFSEDRIFMETGDVTNSEFIESIIKKYGCPDIVSDDASHMSSAIKQSFNLLYSRTKVCYVIEDYGTQRKEFMNGSFINDGIPATNIMYDMIDKLMESRIMKSIKIYHSICFFFK